MPRAECGHHLLSTQLLLPVRAAVTPYPELLARARYLECCDNKGLSSHLLTIHTSLPGCRCGNMAAIMEVDEHMNKSFSQVGGWVGGLGTGRRHLAAHGRRAAGRSGARGTWLLTAAVCEPQAARLPTPCSDVWDSAVTLSPLLPPPPSLLVQFDPAPRRGEPEVTRRTPDYFL